MNYKKSTLFVDESGKSSLKEQANNPFVMTGVIIDDTETNSIQGYFNYIKRKYRIPLDRPFHSYHIYEHPNNKLPDSKLHDLSTNLADLISLIPAKVMILEINKAKFKRALGVSSDSDFKGTSKRKEMPDFPYRVMSSKLFTRFADYLHTNKAIGQVICDSRRGADHHMLNTLNMCKQGNMFTLSKTQSNLINDRISAISFTEKNYLSGGLEITDLISYTSYFRVRRLLKSNSHLGLDKIWKQINLVTRIEKISEGEVKRFFGIKKGEVHKYLNS